MIYLKYDDAERDVSHTAAFANWPRTQGMAPFLYFSSRFFSPIDDIQKSFEARFVSCCFDICLSLFIVTALLVSLLDAMAFRCDRLAFLAFRSPSREAMRIAENASSLLATFKCALSVSYKYYIAAFHGSPAEPPAAVLRHVFEIVISRGILMMRNFSSASAHSF